MNEFDVDYYGGIIFFYYFFQRDYPFNAKLKQFSILYIFYTQIW